MERTGGTDRRKVTVNDERRAHKRSTALSTWKTPFPKITVCSAVCDLVRHSKTVLRGIWRECRHRDEQRKNWLANVKEWTVVHCRSPETYLNGEPCPQLRLSSDQYRKTSIIVRQLWCHSMDELDSSASAW